MDALQRLCARMIAPLARRLRLLVGRAIITAIQDSGKVQAAQVKLLEGEVRDDVEVLMQYGFTSVLAGPGEGLYFAVGGDRDHGILACVADREKRLKDLKPGEVAIYDDLGQQIYLTREGILIDGAKLPITIKNTPKVTVQAEAEIHLEAKTVTIRAEEKVRIETPSFEVAAQTSVMLQSPSVLLDSPQTQTTGNATVGQSLTVGQGLAVTGAGGGVSTITGDLKVKGGKIDIEGGISCNGKNIGDAHGHSGVTPGNGTTGPVV